MSRSEVHLSGEHAASLFGTAEGDDAGAPRSRERTRARLMQAAYEVFAEEGLAGSSVEDICERAGFTRGAFYSNFASKDELFVELVRVVTDRKLTLVSERVAGLRERDADPTPIEIVQHALEHMVEDDFGVFVMSEIRLQAMRDDATAAAFRAWEANFLERVASLIDDVITPYGYRLRLPVVEMARLVTGVWENALIDAVIARMSHDDLRALAAARVQQLAVTLVDAS